MHGLYGIRYRSSAVESSTLVGYPLMRIRRNGGLDVKESKSSLSCAVIPFPQAAKMLYRIF